jgi:uncharacterized protein YjdB
VVVSPNNVSLVPQQTVAITATVLDQTGSVLTGRTVEWSTSAAAIASVSSTGLVTGVSSGAVTVVASSEGRSGTAAVTVRDGLFVGPAGGQATTASGSVTLTVPAQALASTIPITITAVASPPSAAQVIPASAYEFGPEGTQFNQPVTIRIRYEASQIPPGATPAQFRLARLVGSTWTTVAGSTVDVATRMVTGQAGSFSLYAIQQIAAPVATVTVAPSSSSIGLGSTLQLSATLRDAANNTLTDRTVTWSSSNAAIASVNSTTGLVTANAVGGPVTMTATSEGQVGTAQVSVTAAVASVTVAPPSGTLQLGATLQLTATVRDAANNILTDREVTWSSTNSAIATVSNSGLVTALTSGGPISILATSEGHSGSAQITVASPPVATVELVGSTRLKVGDDYFYVAVAKDAQGNVLDKQVTWSILETGKGTMSASGLLTPSQTGTITIRIGIDGVNYDRPVTAYDWEVNGLFLRLAADHEITNQSGATEIPALTISCSGGTFQFAVTTANVVMGTANVQYALGGGAKIPDTWVLIDANRSLRHPGVSNAAQKSFAQSVATFRLFAIQFVETGGTPHGVTFRTTGLGAILPPVVNGCP